MPAVVRPGCKFVDEYLTGLGYEELHAEHANELDLRRHITGHGLSRSDDRRGDPRRNNGEVEDVVGMNILRHREYRHVPIGGTRHHGRNLAGKIDELLDHYWLAGETLRRDHHVGLSHHLELALAVVAEV